MPYGSEPDCFQIFLDMSDRVGSLPPPALALSASFWKLINKLPDTAVHPPIYRMADELAIHFFFRGNLRNKRQNRTLKISIQKNSYFYNFYL